MFMAVPARPLGGVLSNNDRNDEASAQPGGVRYSGPSERPYVLNYWANALPARAEPDRGTRGAPLYRRRTPKRLLDRYNNIMYAVMPRRRRKVFAVVNS